MGTDRIDHCLTRTFSRYHTLSKRPITRHINMQFVALLTFAAMACYVSGIPEIMPDMCGPCKTFMTNAQSLDVDNREDFKAALLAQCDTRASPVYCRARLEMFTAERVFEMTSAGLTPDEICTAIEMC